MANSKCSTMVNKAVSDGFLPHISTLKCVDCGNQAQHYDHRNYDYPLGVEPTCLQCNINRGKASGLHDDLSFSGEIKIRDVPETLKNKIKRDAKKCGRSMNKQIVAVLKEVYK